MPDKEFIHSSADVPSTLLYVFDSGLQIIHDEPQAEPQPRFLTRAEAANLMKGSFYVFQPDWVFGTLQTSAIQEGHNKGKYYLHPRTNYTAVSVHFHGERTDHGQRRLGSCTVACHSVWLQQPQKTIQTATPEVRQWYKRIVAHLSSKVVIEAGVHRYCVTRGVLADPTASACLPPFDYIPWEPNGWIKETQ